MSQTITPAELHQRIIAKPDAIVIDVRTPSEFAAVHVPQARNAPLADFDPISFVAAARGGEPVYLLCHSGRRAADAAQQFVAAGFQNAVVVEGGTEAWEKAGLPVTRGAGVISIERQVRIAAGAIVLTGIVLGWFVHRYFFGLSAFVGAGLVFAGVSDWCGMGLLLAKAPWNQRRTA
jgi:rhodanese-related sulfurtransferase